MKNISPGPLYRIAKILFVSIDFILIAAAIEFVHRQELRMGYKL